MRKNSYILSHFVSPALRFIVTGKVSSVYGRLAIVLKMEYGCGIEADDFPERVRADWLAIEAVRSRPISPLYRGISDKSEALAHSLTRKEAQQALESFLRIALCGNRTSGAKPVITALLL